MKRGTREEKANESPPDVGIGIADGAQPCATSPSPSPSSPPPPVESTDIRAGRGRRGKGGKGLRSLDSLCLVVFLQIRYPLRRPVLMPTTRSISRLKPERTEELAGARVGAESERSRGREGGRYIYIGIIVREVGTSKGS